jgi:hypothetical protein
MSKSMVAYIIVTNLILILLLGLAVDALTDVGPFAAYAGTIGFILITAAFVFMYAFHRGRRAKQAERG